MPEGPSIVIAKELMQPFIGKKIKEATGNVKTFDIEQLAGQKITDIKSWGKHLLLCFKEFTVRVHFLMFGSYTINDEKDRLPRLRLVFPKGSLNFYSCAVRLVDGDVNEVYDWTADVMNEHFDRKAAASKLKQIPDTMVCDALLDQNIFSGVGNIIKNEVLFRIKVNPKTLVGNLPPKKRKELIDEAVNYSFDFLEWKKEYTLRKHWLAHTKRTCPRDGSPIIKEYLGKTNRRTFYCPVCQKLYQ